MAKVHRKKGGEFELPSPTPYTEPPRELTHWQKFCSLCGGSGHIVTPTGEWHGRCPYHPDLGDDL